MQGKSSSALDHVENGLNIIREWRDSRNSDIGSSPIDAGSEVIENRIGPMFGSLEEQIANLHSNRDKDVIDLSKDVSQPQLLPFLMPRAFGSFDEAHKYLRGVMSLVTHAMRLYSLFPNPTLDSVRALQARNYLDDWLRSFEALKKIQTHEEFDNKLSVTCALLEINYRAFCIMLESFPGPDEMKFDNFSADFAFIVTQSRAFIVQRHSHVDTVVDEDVDHSADFHDINRLDLIAPLFLTATRCRVPYLRRQALSLLGDLQSVDSVWNSTSAARIAEQVMLIEERGFDTVGTKTEIGDHRRIRLSSAEFNIESGKLRIKFSRSPYREQDMLDEEEIVWPARVSLVNRIEALDPVPSSRGILRMVGYHNLCDSDDTCSFVKNDACYGRRNFEWACKTWSRATAI